MTKLTLFIGTLIILLFGLKPPVEQAENVTTKSQTAMLIFVIISAFAVSMAWTSGSQVEALNSFSKYGKLLTIPIFLVLVRSRVEALYALASFSLAQLFLILSAWMIFFKIPLPWVLSQYLISNNVVFSSYLDESLMSAVFAAVSWHLKDLVPGKYGRYFAISAALLALGHVFFLLQGRSAHVVAILLMTLAVAWGLPRRYRIAIGVVPVFLVTVLYFISPKVQLRLDSLKKEVQSFSFKQGVDVSSGSSSGVRLHFWHRAVQSIAENPFFGSGAGSWTNEFNRLERINNPTHTNIQPLGNPHQEYLLWGVQLGVPGILLFLALLLSILKDTLSMDSPSARAAQSALLGLAVACLFNSSLYDAQIGDYFCVVLGLLLVLGTFPKTPKQTPGHQQTNYSPA